MKRFALILILGCGGSDVPPLEYSHGEPSPTDASVVHRHDAASDASSVVDAGPDAKIHDAALQSPSDASDAQEDVTPQPSCESQYCASVRGCGAYSSTACGGTSIDCGGCAAPIGARCGGDLPNQCSNYCMERGWEDFCGQAQSAFTPHWTFDGRCTTGTPYTIQVAPDGGSNFSLRGSGRDQCVFISSIGLGFGSWCCP